MKIFYFGTICDLAEYEKIIKNSKSKPTVATVVFESALLNGFHQNGADLTVYSSPMIPTYPSSKLLSWGNKQENLPCGYTCTWLKTCNLPVLKQLSRRANGKKVLKQWLKQNQGEDCTVMTYGISPFLTKDVLALCQRYGAQSCAIVPDLPRDMYLNETHKNFQTILKQQYLKPTLKQQGNFDRYVYLTGAMANEINPQKPYIVMEGILDEKTPFSAEPIAKSEPHGIMYAGGLNEKYGIMNLLDAFESAAIPNTELWLFGDGNAVEKIREKALQNPAIRLFGHMSRNEVLRYEQQATLLVNPRSPDDAFTKFSFPSKTIEYMYSGTPLLTTALNGIPAEYFDYVFSVEDNTSQTLAHALQEIFALPTETLAERGNQAKKFVFEHKNAKVQASRILKFLKS